MYKKLLLIGLMPFWVGCASKPLVSYYDMGCTQLLEKEATLQEEYATSTGLAVTMEVLDLLDDDKASSTTTGAQTSASSEKQEIREIQQAIYSKKCKRPQIKTKEK